MALTLQDRAPAPVKQQPSGAPTNGLDLVARKNSPDAARVIDGILNGTEPAVDLAALFSALDESTRSSFIAKRMGELQAFSGDDVLETRWPTTLQMHRPHLLSVLALAAAACSAPAAPRPVVPPPRVEAAPAPADAAVVANAVHTESQPAPLDAQPAPPAPPRRPGAFDWQEIRDKYAQLFKLPVDTFRCDYRSKYPTLDPVWGVLADCAESPPPNRLAAEVISVGTTDDGRCEIMFDIGGDTLISSSWSGALLDAEDVPVTKWAHLRVMNQRRGLLIVKCDRRAALSFPHVALVRDLRWR